MRWAARFPPWPRHARPLVRACLVLAALAPACPARAAPAMRLVPAPASLDSLGPAFAIPRDPVIVLDSPDTTDRFAAQLLAAELAEQGHPAAPLASRGAGTFVLSRVAPDTLLGDEGYALECTAAGVRLSAATAAGLFYGVQTLCQLVTPEGIAQVRIRDRPALRWRGVLEDISRAGAPLEEALEHRIELAASFKLNTYFLYNETSIVTRSQPLLTRAGEALTADDIRALVAFARRRHVTLALAQQSLGHSAEVLRHERYHALALRPGSDVLAPGSAAVYAYLDSVYVDLVPLFDGPFTHVGADEPGDLGAPGTRSAASGEARFADHIARLSAMLEHEQRRLVLWSDYPIAHPNVIAQLPRRNVVAVWDYSARSSYDSLLTPFRDARLDVLVCPGMMNWKRLFPRVDEAEQNAARLTRDGVRAGAIGQINCAWADDGEFLAGVLDYPLVYGAAAAWQGERVPDPADVAADFDWTAYRLDGHRVGEAVRLLSGIHDRFERTGGPDASVRLLDLSPMNPADHRLLGVLDSTATDVAHDAERATQLLASARGECRRNADDLDAHLFAARRLHLLATGLELGRRWLPLYRHALAMQAARRPSAAAEDLGQIVTRLAETRDEAFEVRYAHAELLERQLQPGRRERMLLRDDRACRRWSDLYDSFSRLSLWAELGQPLPPERTLAIP